MKIQGRRKRERPKRRWLDKVKDDIKEKEMSGDEVSTVLWRRMSSYMASHKSGDKMKTKKKSTDRLGNTILKLIPNMQMRYMGNQQQNNYKWFR